MDKVWNGISLFFQSSFSSWDFYLAFVAFHRLDSVRKIRIKEPVSSWSNKSYVFLCFFFFNSSRVFLMVTPFYCRRTQWKYRRRVLAIGGGNRFLEIVNGHSILLSSNPTTNVRNVFCRLVERARWGGKKKQDTIDPWRWASIFARRLCFPVSSLRTGWPFLSTDGYSSHLKAGTCCYFFSTTPNVGRPYRYVATVDAAMMERDVSDLLHKVHRVSFRCVVYDRVSLPHRTRPAFTALLHLIMLMAAPC